LVFVLGIDPCVGTDTKKNCMIPYVLTGYMIVIYTRNEIKFKMEFLLLGHSSLSVKLINTSPASFGCIQEANI